MRIAAVTYAAVKRASCGGDDKFMLLLGCSTRELRRHIENRFKPGMSWKNQGRGGWTIDHKKPYAAFDLNKEEDILAVANYRNIQPLWEKENLQKNSFYRR